MKLCLYSGGLREQNHVLNQKLLGLLPGKKIKITYIPSAGDENRKYYREFQEWFNFYGLRNLAFFSLERDFRESAAKEALSSEAIYLSGGNTFHFLFWLRKRKFLNRLKGFVKKGGILIGLSAGSILMTPTIKISGIPSYNHDENEVGIKNLKSLALVNFEFFPHFRPNPRLEREIVGYSQTSPYSIFALEEGSGIIIWDQETFFVGSHKIYCHGREV